MATYVASPGETLNISLDLRAPFLVQVTGRVEDQHGAPVSGVSIMSTSPSHRYYSTETVTEKDGAIRATMWSFSENQISAAGKGCYAAQYVSVTDQPVTVTLVLTCNSDRTFVDR
jgi:hypothetical protein